MVKTVRNEVILPLPKQQQVESACSRHAEDVWDCPGQSSRQQTPHSHLWLAREDQRLVWLMPELVHTWKWQPFAEMDFHINWFSLVSGHSDGELCIKIQWQMSLAESSSLSTEDVFSITFCIAALPSEAPNSIPCLSTFSSFTRSYFILAIHHSKLREINKTQNYDKDWLQTHFPMP